MIRVGVVDANDGQVVLAAVALGGEEVLGIDEEAIAAIVVVGSIGVIGFGEPQGCVIGGPGVGGGPNVVTVGGAIDRVAWGFGGGEDPQQQATAFFGVGLVGVGGEGLVLWLSEVQHGAMGPKGMGLRSWVYS